MAITNTLMMVQAGYPNELRNNNTIAHPNGQLIQAREAQLVIRHVNAVVDYIEDIERSLS